jgi:hypothetical protein
VKTDAEFLAWADAHGYTFAWEDDWELVGRTHCEEYGEAYADGEPDTCEQCIMYDSDGKLMDALGCIDNADDAYRRDIEADMARAIYPLRQRAERRTRSTIRARRRNLNRKVVK